jgi:hypothetical protein
VSASQYWQDSLIAGVADTAEKFISGVVDNGKQFFSGIVDTGDKVLAVWLFLTGINDTREKCIDVRGLLLLKNYLRPLKSATATDIVIGTAMKTCKGTSQTLIRGPGGRQSYFKPKRHYLVLAASEASDQDVWGVFGCNFSWRCQ